MSIERVLLQTLKFDLQVSIGHLCFPDAGDLLSLGGAPVPVPVVLCQTVQDRQGKDTEDGTDGMDIRKRQSMHHTLSTGNQRTPSKCSKPAAHVC